MLFDKSRKIDRQLYNDSAELYIPIACHYNENTLITKNGELLQIIQINGINSEKISEKLFNLREVVREAIRKNINSNSFAFWIHTVRRRTNLDDPLPYKKLLAANIHALWCKKNYWDDKFVNTLYISIIYQSAAIKVKNFTALINSLSFKLVADFQDAYFKEACEILNSSTNKILRDLEDYGAIKLGIYFEGNKSFSEPMFLYRRIVHLSEENCLVPLAGLSTTLASNRYAVGSDKIEVISESGKKFAAILSIKEYREVSSTSLDDFLQLPIEFIATEVFYFVPRKKVMATFSEQDYLLKVSGDMELRDIKGISSIMDMDERAGVNQFCHQQISIMVIGDKLEKLEKDVESASKSLAKIGIVHVREDIKLEQTFWAQLPGNFNYLRRMTSTILENTAALSSLHNFPVGEQYNPFGRAITLLRTEKGTPYFMNLHTKSGGAITCIFGTSRTGKTVLTNFLLSETTKFNPAIVYLSTDNSSKIFIEALEGSWHEQEKGVVNPFLCDGSSEDKEFCQEFLRIICNHYVLPLFEQELAFLELLIEEIFTWDPSKRNLSTILKELDFSKPGGEVILSRLAIFDEGGLYNGLFDNKEAFNFKDGDITGFNLEHITDKSFTKRFFPTEKKLIDQFTANLNLHASVRYGLIYALSYYLNKSSPRPKILVVDNLDALFNFNYFTSLTASIFNSLTDNNGIVLTNFNLNSWQGAETENYQKWLPFIDTIIVLPSDVKLTNLDKTLGLSKAEIERLSSLLISSRMFLIKREGQTVVAELSIGGLTGIVKILSSSDYELEIYQKIVSTNPGHPENWINPFYKALING